MATVDAAPKVGTPIIPSNLIDENVIGCMEDDMELWEQICCIFFMIEDYRCGYKSLTKVLNEERRKILRFVEYNGIEDWQGKLIEALCVMQNNEMLLNLGVVPEEARIMYSTRIVERSYKINKFAKAFYALFESFNKEDAHELLERVYQTVCIPDCHSWPAKVSLELHLLWWIEQGFINVSQGRWNLSNLLTILKQMGMSTGGVYQTLKIYNKENETSACHYDDRSNGMGDVSNARSQSVAAKDKDDLEEKYEIEKGLVVVFNLMRFSGPIDYPYRIGSRQDCRRIVETFQETFGFEVKVHDNLESDKIYSELENLQYVAKDYDCVVVFVLSHGTYGNIVASDGLECPIETLKSKLCSDVLKEKPKILVIQACQTQTLTTDGPTREEKNLARFEDLLVLNSTIPGELSVRDPARGTWFVEILCDVLIQNMNQSIDRCFTQVCKRFKSKSAFIDNRNVRQVPIWHSTLAKLLILPKVSNRRTSQEA